MRAMSGLRRALGEPLLQFMVIGALLFAGYRLVHPERPATLEGNRIELTAADVRQVEIVWTAQWHRAPTQDELQGLLESRVREEILYREALALGLDRDDIIVRRQLARKMEFLAEDVSAIGEPTAEELGAWFAGNAQRFAESPRVSFRHLYFSSDRRGPRALEEAGLAVRALAGKSGAWPGAARLADAFMLQDHYADRSFEQMAKEFGPGFAKSLFELTPGSWQGPIESGYGWHVVWVDSITPGRVPALEEVEPDAKAAWVAERRAEAKRKAFDAMRARYEVVLSGSTARASAVGGATPPRTAP